MYCKFISFKFQPIRFVHHLSHSDKQATRLNFERIDVFKTGTTVSTSCIDEHAATGTEYHVMIESGKYWATYHLSRDTALLTNLKVCHAKTQISLRIRAVWSESSQRTL